MNKFVVGLCTLVELGCITTLAAIGFKRNKDTYNTKLKAIELECKLWEAEFNNSIKDATIERLTRKLKDLGVEES